MNWLAIETSTERASVALSVNGMVHTQEHVGARTHAQLILPSVQALLIKAGVDLAELDGIIFGRGPGSFTGLRVACSIAKGLAYAHDLPLYPVSTLAAIINTAVFEKAEAMAVLAVLDARMNQVYWTYAAEGNPVVLDEKVSDVVDIQLPGDASFCVAGVGWADYEKSCSPEIIKRIADRKVIYPHAVAMIRLVEQGVVEPVLAGEALPVYIRDKVTS